MAIVKKMLPKGLERDAPHTEVECTYAIVEDATHGKCLQIDTYGSRSREIPGKKSQSLRLSKEAINQLKEIFQSHF
jgi:hypothetical protein